MFLFQQLQLAGLNQKDIQSSPIVDIIQLEKKLLAENRLNASISKNDIQNLLEILKTYPDEVKLLARSDFFYSLLSGQEPERFSKFVVNTNIQVAKVKAFLYECFREDILDFFTKNASRNQWGKLSVLFKYKRFLDERLIRQCTYKLEEKLHFATDMLEKQLEEGELEKMLPYLKNTQFYDLLSTINFNYFDNLILDLIRDVERCQRSANTDFYSSVRMAAISYKPSDSRFNPYVDEAPRYSSREVSYDSGLSPVRIILLIVAIVRILLWLSKG